jgi:hypothetical protein
MYGSLDDLAKRVMKPTNCRSSAVSPQAKYNSVFNAQKPVYVYTDVIQPNLSGDPYFRHLQTLTFHRKQGTINLTTRCTGLLNNPP